MNVTATFSYSLTIDWPETSPLDPPAPTRRAAHNIVSVSGDYPHIHAALNDLGQKVKREAEQGIVDTLAAEKLPWEGITLTWLFLNLLHFTTSESSDRPVIVGAN